jgi:hypothetical protein
LTFKRTQYFLNYIIVNLNDYLSSTPTRSDPAIPFGGTVFERQLLGLQRAQGAAVEDQVGGDIPGLHLEEDGLRYFREDSVHGVSRIEGTAFEEETIYIWVTECTSTVLLSEFRSIGHVHHSLGFEILFISY